MNHTIRKGIVISLCLLLLAPALPALAQTAGVPLPAAELSNADQRTTWDDSTATHITLGGASATVTGEGAVAEGGTITISKPGTYVVTGTLDDGQIIITLSKEDKAQLVLSDAHITCKTGAPIYATSCDKLIVTLPEGTESSLTDGGSAFTYADQGEEEPNAALFCKDDLTINGAGSLTVKAGFHNGIGSKDDLTIVGSTIVVDAANHALRGNDSILLAGATLTLTAGGDGMQTNNTKEADKGWIVMDGGSASILASKDGMQADTALVIRSGSLAITAGGGHDMTQPLPPTTSDSTSCKGLKSDGTMTVAGGDVTINSYDDCLNAKDTVTLSGGTLALSTGDDAVHSDTELLLTGSNLAVENAYEGLEAANITISSGNIFISSTDDAVNAAGSGDEELVDADEDYGVAIFGGTVKIVSSGDGIDSNVNISLSGGTLEVLVQSKRGNMALDASGSLLLTGGTVIYGGTDTGNAPAGVSTQSFVLVSDVPAGQQVTVMRDGKELLAFTPEADCPYLALSCPDIQAEESYDLLIGGEAAGSIVAGHNKREKR